MINTSTNYITEIKKPSRNFECKVTIGDNVYTNKDIVNVVLDYPQSQDGFSIGNTISQSLDLTLINNGNTIFSTSQIKVEIGLKVGSTIEYIPMGIFNIDDIEKTDYTTKITAFDNMIKFETPYFGGSEDADLTQVINGLSVRSGVSIIGNFPNYKVSKLNGFTCREVLSYVASICAGNAIVNRDGNIVIKSLKETDNTISKENYFDYTKEETAYKIGKISCQVDNNNILSKGALGTDSIELFFENPWATETILTEIYNKLNGLTYLGYSIKWQGDLSLEPYDIVSITDTKNVTRKTPILAQKFTYTGGLTSEIGARGESKNKNSFSSGGSTTNKINRVVIEQAIIKDALIEKANIKDLEATNANIQNLIVEDAKINNALINKAEIKDLEATNANIQNLIAEDAKINTALINKADIVELNAIKGTINVLDSDFANIKTLVNGNLSSENIQAGGITSDRLTIADGFINNAMIANLDVSKINAGDISTNKFRIVSDSGKMLIADNTIQIRDNNRARVQIGKDASNDYNMYVWDNAGNLMFDATGLKANGIKNKIIRDDMISDNANIAGSKINVGSLVTEINKDTNTSVIKSSKVQLDTVGQTLDVAFNSLKSQVDGVKDLTESNNTTIGVMQGQISTAINNTQIIKDGKVVLLKDDYNRTVAKVDSINSTIGSQTTKIDQLTGNITNVDTKVNSVQRDLEGTTSTVSSHSVSIDNLNSTVSTQSSSISQLKDKIALKVEQTDIDNAITSVENKVASTNSKVASLETNLSSITSRVSTTESNIKTTNDDISSLQTRMNTAEQKITDSAIINTVQSTINNAKNEAINSANSSTDNKLNNYATKSSMELTANQLRLDFSSSGGMNLVKDGQFKAWDWNNGKWWWFDSNVRIYERNVVNGTGVGFYSEDSSRARLYSNYMNLKPNTTYTVVMDLVKEVNVYYDNVSVEFKNSNGDILYTHNCSTNGSTFTTPDNTSGGYLIITHGGRSNSNGGFVLWVNNVAIYEGTTALPYSPHPDEVYEGNTVIDAQGIKIYNGALTVLNKNRDVMLQADNDGNLTFKGRLQPNDYQLKLFGNDCKIDGSANAIRMQLTPQIYCGMDSEGGFRIFNQHSNWGARYTSILMTPEGHSSIYNDRTRVKLLGAQNARPVVQSRNTGDNAYGDFHGADFLNRSTIKDKTNVQNTKELDCTKIILENNIFKYNLKSDVQHILEKFGLSEEYDLSDIEGCSADERVGFILEELTEEAKEILSPGDMESISIYSMCSILWKAFQEQQKRIETLESLLKK